MEYSVISSRKNEKIIHASKLSEKKYRDREGLFITDGAKLLEEAVYEKLEIIRVFFTESALKKYGALLDSCKALEYFCVTPEVFEKLTEEASPQGIAAIIKKPDVGEFTDSEKRDGGFLILEDLQNPLNIGALFRCAYSLGTDKIILTKSCADVYGAKVLRSAMGSIFKTKFFYCDNLTSFIEEQLSFSNRVICTTLSDNSEMLGKFSFCKGDSIVIGNEGNGIKDETVNLCKNSIIIPMQSGAESLNAATACAVVLWEMNKYKLIKINCKGELSNG